jgi:uncharacterized membrane protein
LGLVGHLVLVTVLLLLGGSLLLVGALGWMARLPRNRWAGVRTPASMSSDEAFAAANRVAGPVVVTAGAVAVLSGLLAIGTDSALRAVLASIGLVGAIVLTLAGGVLGNRAATLAPKSPCAGCACGAGGCGAITG